MSKMPFQWPERRGHETSRGTVYSICHVEAQHPHRTLVLLHGFPSQLYDWTRQVEHFAELGYGIVALDMLGYGQSSKPDDVTAYRLRPMSDDIIEIMDMLGLSRAIGIGHDFGATLLSRAVAYYPDRWLAAVFLAVGPPRMGTPFDVEAINAMTKQMLGYEFLGYIPWLGAQTDAQQSLEEHAEAAMSLVFCADQEDWTQWYRPLGKMRQFVRENRRVPIGSWYPPDLQHRHLEAFGKVDGYKGAVRWYQMWLGNLFAPDEKGYEDTDFSLPTLFIGGDGSEQQKGLLGAWAPNLTTIDVRGGHWIQLECAKEINSAIERFLVKLGEP